MFWNDERGRLIRRCGAIASVVLLASCTASCGSDDPPAPTSSAISTATLSASDAGAPAVLSTVVSLSLPGGSIAVTAQPEVTATKAPAPTPASPATGGTIGDLQLSVPIRNLGCTGQYVLVIGSSIDPGNYRLEVETFLQGYPGSSYLLTEVSCSAFEQRLDGNQIYAAYFGPYDNSAQACSARDDLGEVGYVKVLKDVNPDDALVEC